METDIYKKIETLKTWLDYTHCGIVMKIKTVADAEKLYDTLTLIGEEDSNLGYEFLDSVDDEEVMTRLEIAIGYKIF